jgi:hypothetical protein
LTFDFSDALNLDRNVLFAGFGEVSKTFEWFVKRFNISFVFVELFFFLLDGFLPFLGSNSIILGLNY